jgi:hypothetical protein
MNHASDEPFRNISHAIEAVPTYRCPCCRSLTLCGRAEDEICPVCYWEDDGQDDHDADQIRGGPNRNLSLRDAQKNYAKYGAADHRFAAKVRPPVPTEL